MSDKLLSVKEAKADIIKFWGEPSLRSPACLDKLISAVRREQDEIATKREREGVVKIIEALEEKWDLVGRQLCVRMLPKTDSELVQIIRNGQANVTCALKKKILDYPIKKEELI